MTTIETQINETENENIEMFFSEQLESQKELFLGARIDMYAILADAFRYPDTMTRMYIRNGEFRNHLLRIMGGLPYVIELGENERSLLAYTDGMDDDDVEAEYIRLFEAGPGNPPCALVEGIHKDENDSRKAIFKDLILFYNNFGLSYAEGNSEDQPDHITYELEFLHYLAFLELKAVQKGRDPKALQHAQKEFLERHPAAWTFMLADKMKEIEDDLREGVNKDVVAFYRNVMVLTDRFVQADFNYIENLTEES